MILVKYGFDMPKIEEGTEFCAVFEGKDGKPTEEWFVADDKEHFAEELKRVLGGRFLLGLYREVPFEIK